MFLQKNNILEPKFVITINKKSYTVVGKFKVLKAIQQGFDTEITELSGQLLTMKFTDMVKLIRIALYHESVFEMYPPSNNKDCTTCQERLQDEKNKEAELDTKKLSHETIEEWIVDDGGIDDTRCLLFDFMRTSIVPKKKRKEAHENAVALLNGLLKTQIQLAELAKDSLGVNTDNFA